MIFEQAGLNEFSPVMPFLDFDANHTGREVLESYGFLPGLNDLTINNIAVTDDDIQTAGISAGVVFGVELQAFHFKQAPSYSQLRNNQNYR